MEIFNTVSEIFCWLFFASSIVQCF